MRNVFPILAPAGRLDSPESIAVILWDLRRARRSRPFDCLGRAHIQIQLRLLWCEIHEAAGCDERVDELHEEIDRIRTEVERVASLHLGHYLERRTVDV